MVAILVYVVMRADSLKQNGGLPLVTCERENDTKVVATRTGQRIPEFAIEFMRFEGRAEGISHHEAGCDEQTFGQFGLALQQSCGITNE